MVSSDVIRFSESAATMQLCAPVRLSRPGGSACYASNPFRTSQRHADDASPPPFDPLIRVADFNLGPDADDDDVADFVNSAAATHNLRGQESCLSSSLPRQSRRTRTSSAANVTLPPPSPGAVGSG